MVEDAKWIYENCDAGTIITVFENENYDPEYTMALKNKTAVFTVDETISGRTLKRGEQGVDVYLVQMRLKELGYYNSTVTGGYYDGTIAAVKAFQRDHGLTVDGVAGKKTQEALFH